jgi:hypothetical protein
MARFYTYGWQYAEARKEPEGEPLAHAAGSRFTSRGIEPGDVVYIVAVHKGGLHLLGKMAVGAIVGKDEARRALSAEPYDAPEHLIACACTPTRLVAVPEEVARQLRFVSRSGSDSLAFREDGTLDPQTLRGIRELTGESSERLDGLLEPMAPFLPPGQSPTAP